MLCETRPTRHGSGVQVDPIFAFAVLALLNFTAFAVQGFDKWFARRSSSRIRESTLLWLGVPLAAPGMWLGMLTFRHKTRKASFLAMAWMVTIVNLALFGLGAWMMGRDYFTLGGS